MRDSETSSETVPDGRSTLSDKEIKKTELIPTFNEDLWLDRIARRLGFGWLSDLLPRNVPPSYLYAVILVVTLETIISIRGILVGEPSVYLQNPFFVLQPIGLLGLVYGARSLRRKYHRVMYEMCIEDRTEDPDQFTDIVPNWLPWTLTFIAVTATYIQVALLGGPVEIYRESGLGVMLGWTIANPVWATITVQFMVVYVSIELIAPWRLWKSDIGIDFFDPEGLGGLRPIGELVKHTYYYAVVGLVAYALVLYGPILSAPEWEANQGTSILFTAVWLGTVATVAFAVFVLHRFMHREKRDELHRLRMLEQEHIDNPWDGKPHESTGAKEALINDIRQQMDRVSATSEYPATFSIWSQLLLSIIIPKASQLLIAGV